MTAVRPLIDAARYAAAEQLLPARAYELIVGGEIAPTFIAGSDRFWFLDMSAEGHRFLVVDPGRGEPAPLFDHDALAAALAEAAAMDVDPARLPFASVIACADASLYLAAAGRQYRWDGERCEDVGAAETWQTYAVSPDGRWALRRDGYDVALVDLPSGGERRLTTDGTEDRGYGVQLDWWTFRIERRGGRGLAPLVVWSPDSSRFVIECIDETRVEHSHLLETTDGRPRLHTFAYALPGDEHVPQSSLYVVDAESGAVVPVEREPVPITLGPRLALGWVRWSPDSARVEVLERDRLFRSARLVAVEPRTGAASTLVDERDQLLVEPAEAWAEGPNMRSLASGGAVWFSRRDGWGHLWHVEGDEWRQLTAGPWVVRDLLHVDEDARAVYFTASGREQGRHPYHRLLYRVTLDGGEPELLTTEEGDHQVTFAPSGRAFLDCFSSNAVAPTTLLRGLDGEERRLATADVTRLQRSSWTEPIPFAVRAADGETPIHGVLYPPPNASEEAPVPIVEVAYPGPMKVASRFRFGFNMYGCEAIASLGFAVVTIEGRGTPFRSRAFHAASYGHLEFETMLHDHVAALDQLAERYPWVDRDRVAMIGVSGGGYLSARAILTHPETYSVAVSAAGNHDNRRLTAGWAEPYLGRPQDDSEAWRRQSNLTVAANLRGKLLLAWGAVDNNVPQDSSLALAQALIDANRDVDMLVMPQEDHFFWFESPYFIRRCWDYLVRHLLGETPPEYEISPRSTLRAW